MSCRYWRTGNSAIVASVDGLGIAGREGKAVLVGVYAVAALGGDLGPGPGRT